MFGFKKRIKKELFDIQKEIFNQKQQLNNEFMQRNSLKIQLNELQEKIEKAIPTFNKLIENQKEITTYINGSTKLFQRIIKFIKLPKIETKGK